MRTVGTMSDNFNDETTPRTPEPPQYPTQPAGEPPASGPPPGNWVGPQADTTPPKGVERGPVDESAWVRSVYLFGACAASGVLMIVGLLMAVGSLVAVVSPDSGLRDGWDRGLVGATQVVDEGLGVFDEFERMQRQDDFDDICDGETDDSFCEDLADGLDDETSTIPVEVTDSIGLIRDEVHRQIRIGAIAKLVGGLALAVIGFLVFRFHSKQVTVYTRS